jgi:hypothetical protein
MTHMVEYDFDSYCLKPTIHFAVGILDEPEKICFSIGDMSDDHYINIDAWESNEFLDYQKAYSNANTTYTYKKHASELIKRQKKYHKRYPYKHRAMAKVRNALKRGAIIRPEKCSNCNKNKRIEAHHEDYNKPLEVIWLCSKCHKAIHWGLD